MVGRKVASTFLMSSEQIVPLRNNNHRLLLMKNFNIEQTLFIQSVR